MFEIRSIRRTYHQQPIKQVLAEVAAVELVAELIEVFLQELALDAMVHVRKQCLSIGNSDMHPWEHLAYVLRVYHL